MLQQIAFSATLEDQFIEHVQNQTNQAVVTNGVEEHVRQAVGAIKSKIEAMKKVVVYLPMAESLARYCQSDVTLLPSTLNSHWFPTELQREFRWAYVVVTSNYARVVVGSGFYGLGYVLERDDQASSSQTNVWHLWLYDEAAPQPIRLTELSTSVSNRFSAEELEALAFSDPAVAVNDCDLEASQKRLMLEIRFKRLSEAFATCTNWLHCKDGDWMPHYVYGHLESRRLGAEKPSLDLTRWVGKNPSFANYVYLAMFEFCEGRDEWALGALRSSLMQRFSDGKGSLNNRYFLGCIGSLIAYSAEDFALCIIICDRALTDDSHASGYRRRLLDVKAAAEFMEGDAKGAVDVLRTAEQITDEPAFGQGSRTNTEVFLMNAFQRKERDVISNCRNWGVELERWIVPKEFHERGGGEIESDTQMGALYPDSWRARCLSGHTPKK